MTNPDNSKKEMTNPDNSKKEMTNPDKSEKDNSSRTWVTLLFITLWISIGIMAYIKAFQCTHASKKGTESRKISMFILAIILGPFWWILYGWPGELYKTYC